MREKVRMERRGNKRQMEEVRGERREERQEKRWREEVRGKTREKSRDGDKK